MKPAAKTLKTKPYAYYVLFILTVTYILNFIDRTIISILAEEIKAGLMVDDARLGFLYGTAFAVFFSVFGVPLARLADTWNRKKLIGMGVFLWSIMTALSGTANSFIQLAIYRVGVGVGESAAAPASLSMLADSFSQKMRATVYAVWSTGVFIGSGLGFAVGGMTLAAYHRWFPDGNAPFGIADWQLSMFLVGVPGIILAIIIFLMREPKRGEMDGVDIPQVDPHAFKYFLDELKAVVPPFTFISLYEIGGAPLLRLNLVVGSLLSIFAYLFTVWLGSPVQWIAIAFGMYSFMSWLQRLMIIDSHCYQIIFRGKAMIYSILGFSMIGFLAYGMGFWSAPYFIRRFQESPESVGKVVGLIVFASGFSSIVIGGLISDFLKRTMPKARIVMGIASMVAIPFYLAAMYAVEIHMAYIYAAIGVFFGMVWIPSSLAMASELSPPNMRATAVAFNQLAGTLLGLAIGPYLIGEISDSFGRHGYNSADSLQMGVVIACIFVFPVATALLWKASLYVEDDEDRVRKLNHG